jgi:hypothetical protein
VTAVSELFIFVHQLYHKRTLYKLALKIYLIVTDYILNKATGIAVYLTVLFSLQIYGIPFAFSNI